MSREKQIYNKVYTDDRWEQVNKETKGIIDDFIIECKSQKKSEGTQKQYKADLKRIAIYSLLFLDNKSFLQFTKRDVRAFMIYCQEEWGMSAARCNRILSALHSCLNFCEDDDELYEDYTRNVSEKVKGIPGEKVREIQFLTDKEIERLYKKFLKEKRYRDATLLAILYDSGARRNEILQIERNSITQDGNATNVVIGKRAKKFKCLYFKRTKESFALYNATRTDNYNSLFLNAQGEPATDSNIYDWVTSWKKDLNELTGKDYDFLNPHSFRHSFVQNFLSGEHYLCRELDLGKVALEKVKTLCHHESSDTTLGYAQDNEEKDIEELFGIKI